jgi:hypothetical protein
MDRYFTPLKYQLSGKKILKAEITPLPRPMPEGMNDPMPEIFATFEKDFRISLGTYYPDEVSFTADMFVGLTYHEATEMIFIENKKHIQS